MIGKIRKSLYVFEVSIFNPDKNFQITKDFFKTNNKIQIIEKAQDVDCDILSLKFDVEAENDIIPACRELQRVLPYVVKPLMIQGSGNNNIDIKLLPELANVVDRECIISSANENTYKDIIKSVIKNKHKLVLKSPIDIDSCKELNILASEAGLPIDKIITDTDIGGLGYGFDYGYSIIEKLKQEDDRFLNVPIISFASAESLQTKEAKSERFAKCWGELSSRALMLEIASASAVKAAGADIIVLHHPLSIKALKGLV